MLEQSANDRTAQRRLSPRRIRLPTLEVNITEGHGNIAIRVNGHVYPHGKRKDGAETRSVKVFSHGSRVGRLPIYKRHLKAGRSSASPLIRYASGFANSGDALEVRVVHPTDAVAVDCEGDQRVSHAAKVHNLTRAAVKARDEST